MKYYRAHLERLTGLAVSGDGEFARGIAKDKFDGWDVYSHISCEIIQLSFSFLVLILWYCNEGGLCATISADKSVKVTGDSRWSLIPS